MTKWTSHTASIGLAAVLAVAAAAPSFAQGYGWRDGYRGGWRGERVVVAPRYGYGYGYYAPGYDAYAAAPGYGYYAPRRWINENDAVRHGPGPRGSYGNPLGCMNGNTGQPGVLDTSTC